MKKHNFLRIAVITATYAIASGCSALSDCHATRDEWYTDFGNTDIGGYESNTAEVVFAEVSPDHMSEVTSRLGAKTVISLTPEEARQLTTQNPPDTHGLRPYLVRALSYRQETGAYGVWLGEKALYVTYGMLGRRNCYPVYREGLIVWLANPPKAVIITTGIAE